MGRGLRLVVELWEVGAATAAVALLVIAVVVVVVAVVVVMVVAVVVVMGGRLRNALESLHCTSATSAITPTAIASKKAGRG